MCLGLLSGVPESRDFIVGGGETRGPESPLVCLIGGGGGALFTTCVGLLLSTGGGGMPEGEVGGCACDGDHGGGGTIDLDFRFGECCGTGGAGVLCGRA